MIKLLILDRDGVLNNVVMRGNIKSSPRKFSELNLPKDAYQIRELLSNLNIEIAVATNQPDISRGLLNKKNHQLILKRISSFYNIPLENFFVCPHDNFENCKCRKPKPGLILNALKKFNINPWEAVMIGDSLKDINASLKASLKEEIFISKDAKSQLISQMKLKKEVPIFDKTSKALNYIEEKYFSKSFLKSSKKI